MDNKDVLLRKWQIFITWQVGCLSHIVRPHANHDHDHQHYHHHRGGRHHDDDVGNHLVAGVGRLTHIVGPATFTSGGLVGAKIIL